MADLIKKTDTLNQGREKLNEAITFAEQAKWDSGRALSKADNTQKQLDTIVIEGDSSPAADQARVDEKGVVHSTLKTRIDEGFIDVKNQIASTDQELKTATRQVFMKLKSYQSLDYHILTPIDLYEMVETEPFITHPRFSIDSLGLDSSGQYFIRKWTYEPPNYDRTIFIVGGIHGGEVLGSWFVVELFKQLLSDTTIPQLLDIKNNVKIIAIPVANPWGMYQAVKTRYNSNGVDLNRNFDWNWDNQPVDEPFGYQYKGTTPFSEVETRYIRDILTESRGELTAFIDAHSQSYSPTNGWHYLVYPDESTTNELQNMLEFLADSNETIENYVGYADSSSNNYTSRVVNVPSVCLEGISGAHGQIGGTLDNAVNMSYYFNSLIVLSNFSNIKNTISVKTYSNNYADGEVTLANNIQTVLEDTVYNFVVPMDGLVKVDGYVLAKKTEEADLFACRPELEQEGYIRLVEGTEANSIQNTYTDGALPIIPIQMTIPVAAGKLVTFKVSAVNEGVGVCHIKRFNLNITYVSGYNLNLFAPSSMQGYVFV